MFDSSTVNTVLKQANNIITFSSKGQFLCTASFLGQSSPPSCLNVIDSSLLGLAVLLSNGFLLSKWGKGSIWLTVVQCILFPLHESLCFEWQNTKNREKAEVILRMSTRSIWNHRRKVQEERNGKSLKIQTPEIIDKQSKSSASSHHSLLVKKQQHEDSKKKRRNKVRI